MNDPENTRQRPSTSRRFTYASVVGLVLFGLGYVVYQSALFPSIYALIGGKVPDKPKTAIYTRAQMDLDRKAAKKNPESADPKTPLDAEGYYIPPSEDDIPSGPYGDAVRRGRDIFRRTGAYVKDHVGNELACANCHLDNGRRENSAPMWGAYTAYPAFRAKTGAISTLEDRIKGCFMYSMNAAASPAGKPPAPGSDVYRDLMTYMAWLSNGVPTGQKMHGALFPKIPKPKDGYDLKRGLVVFQQNCALCHGANGEGTKDGEGNVKFPPLWGKNSYNWGAGMARIDTAAGFIKANMPFGKPYSLTDQEAWDVAAYLNGQERPKDPRQVGTVAEAAVKYHRGEESYYGKTVDGHVLGSGVGNANEGGGS